METRAQIVLLYASQYEITDESTGEIKRGVTCNYYFRDYFSAKNNDNGSKGMRPAKGSIDFLLMKKIKAAPALYDAQFEMSIGSDGKPVLKVVDLDYVSDVYISAVSEKAPETAGTPEASAEPSAPEASSASPAEPAQAPSRSGKK